MELFPRVARSAQPWAMGRNPVGILRKGRENRLANIFAPLKMWVMNRPAVPGLGDIDAGRLGADGLGTWGVCSSFLVLPVTRASVLMSNSNDREQVGVTSVDDHIGEIRNQSSPNSRDNFRIS